MSLFLRSTRVPFVFKEGEGINQSEKQTVAKIAAMGANMINELTGTLLRKVWYMYLKVFQWDRRKRFKIKLDNFSSKVLKFVLLNRQTRLRGYHLEQFSNEYRKYRRVCDCYARCLM